MSTDKSPFTSNIFDGKISLRDGRTMAYQTCGDPSGWPTVLIHGALGIGDFSDHHNTCMALGLRAISPTLPGWGQSTALSGYSILDWPLDLVELLGHLGVISSGVVQSIISSPLQVTESTSPCFDVVGISLGGPHAMACAIRIPQFVRKALVLSGHAPFVVDQTSIPKSTPSESSPSHNFEATKFQPLRGMGAPAQMGLSWFASKVSLLNKLAGRFVRSKTASALPSKDAVDDSIALEFVNSAVISSLNPVEKQQMQAQGTDFVKQFPHRLARSIALSLQHDLIGYVELPSLLRSWSNRDLLKIPERLSSNMLLVYSDCDQAVPISHGKYIHKHLPQATMRVIKGGGHMSTVFEFGFWLNEFASFNSTTTR